MLHLTQASASGADPLAMNRKNVKLHTYLAQFADLGFPDWPCESWLCRSKHLLQQQMGTMTQFTNVGPIRSDTVRVSVAKVVHCSLEVCSVKESIFMTLDLFVRY